MVLIPNNATLPIEAKDNGTLTATAGENGKVYVLRSVISCIICVYNLEHTTTRIKTHLICIWMVSILLYVHKY